MGLRAGNLQIVELEEFLLSLTDLSNCPHRGESESANLTSFKEDFHSRRLDRYFGTFVAYQNGVLCGQSKDGIKLYAAASSYFGPGCLAVFRIPQSAADDIDFMHARGKLS